MSISDESSLNAVGVAARHGLLDLKSGVGLVIANMIGAGVFLSAGFMAQYLGPGLILISWIVGAGIALSGAIAYAQIAALSGRSGGEYRYLHDSMHPYVGYLAGWASLLIGFSAPLAIDAYVIGAFQQRLGSNISPLMVGTVAILVVTIMHSIQLSWSRSFQNYLVSLKVLFISCFVVTGLVMGNNTWPEWQPPLADNPGFPSGAFLESQYWIAFAFSGWNAAIYAAGEYQNPRRDVSHALILGCLIVTVIYLAVNWVFVANLTPAQAIAVVEYEETRVTLAHLVMQQLIGNTGATVASLVAILVFVSALSAMTVVGPRVYASMADDGFLPNFFRSRAGKPPRGALWIQSGVALLLLHTQTLLDIVKSASAVLMIFSVLTVLTLFRMFRNPGIGCPTRLSLVAAIVYVISVLVILGFGVLSSKAIAVTLCIILLAGSTGYLVSKRYKLVARSRECD